jgi:glyoxylase-like metal-dependent hydrolase (beta-lactamase superfamily II)
MTDRLALPEGITVFERGWLSSNNVLFHGPGPTALVDSGYATHSAQTVALVGSALGGRPLDLLLNTHLHSDHCGGNAALQERYPDVRTLIPPGMAERVREWDPVGLTYAPTGQSCSRFGFTGLLRPGTEIILGSAVWQVHGAPGHDPHSVVLFDPVERILISADALWANGFGIVFPELEGEDGFAEVGATLDLIERLRPETVIPGHGPVFHDLAGALSGARRRLAAFMHDPVKHAAHASKVLIKFKLLELQRVEHSALLGWATGTPYIQLMQQRWFPDRALRDWIEQLMDDLERAGALRADGEFVVNA